MQGVFTLEVRREVSDTLTRARRVLPSGLRRKSGSERENSAMSSDEAFCNLMSPSSSWASMLADRRSSKYAERFVDNRLGFHSMSCNGVAKARMPEDPWTLTSEF